MLLSKVKYIFFLLFIFLCNLLHTSLLGIKVNYKYIFCIYTYQKIYRGTMENTTSFMSRTSYDLMYCANIDL